MDRGVCVVTGGSRGIGAATARRVSAAGWVPCVSWVHRSQAAEQVADETGGIAVRADVQRESDVVALFDAAAEAGPITAVVVNAGIVEPTMRLVDMEAERFRRMVDVNVLGALFTAREAVRRMATSRGGSGGAIVLVSSIAATLGSAGSYVDYAASKGAIDSLTIGLAGETADEGIRVNAVRPGIIDTEIHADAGHPDRAATAGASIPLGRAGTPDEVAAAIAWLLDDDASYVTGAILDVGGGR